MARVTVEDCITKISNQFELTLTAAQRARLLSNGAKPQVPEHEIYNSAGIPNKPAVIALKEISMGYVTPAILRRKS